MLDITRITQNKIHLQRQRLELNELVRQTLEDHRALFEKNGVHLEIGLAPSALFLDADRARLAQVIGKRSYPNMDIVKSDEYRPGD